ncbi:uncharacterized protein LOC124386260 isoform X2 [Silurus meridionalis]|uniref:Ig-like domain-containing protein n=1 Tax=Silurus meridionalis TaxID=175797 RepID=A0A8T0BJ44_SILME|nr:uncharacterized protein LOC124386260 isoform X2 [Silurus meridionalis]KAF7706985.1 hypothetical protein HF521_018203 [Silurus meridionalis]
MLSATIRQFGEKTLSDTMLGIKVVKLIWITAVIFINTDFAQINIINQPNSVITAASGENVTLHCFRLDEKNTDPIIWYKQAVGHEPCVLVTVQKLASNPIFEVNFNSARFTIENSDRSCHLKIANVKPSDEAKYYCGLKIFSIKFGKGTFLSVKGDEDIKVSVFQSSVSDSVPAGASVTLQCSVLSESRAAELQVLWFRAAPSQSHPQLIYTHHNSSLQCESESSTHTCVYNLSKNIFSLNDTGTYYCAVVLCGKIIFGNGTQVQLEKDSQFVVVVCVIVIITETLIICKMRVCEQFRVRPQKVSVIKKRPDQGGDAEELNYAALHFNKKNTKKVMRKKEKPGDCVYSEVSHAT